jgi:hypothetical protein
MQVICRIVIFLVCLAGAARAQIDFPAARGFVNDFAEVIAPAVEDEIDIVCREVKQKTEV